MRRPTSVRAAAALLVLVVVGGCSHSHKDASSKGTTSTTATSVVPDVQDAALQATQVQASDLPVGFIEDTSSNNTVTSFCVNEDAAQGLHASARAYVGFGHAPFGVLELTFRFKDGDAARFVAQADQMLSTCSGVPNIQGEAYTYEPVGAAVEASLAGTDSHAVRFGTSVGSGALTEEVAFFHKGDIGVLIAAVSVSQPRATTDALAITAFAAAVRRAPSK